MATNQVKYVGLIFDEHLTFQPHITVLNAKLKRANNMIAISRHYLVEKLLLHIYYGQFYSHLTYGCQIWGQNENALNHTLTLQKKAIRLMSFAHFQEHCSPLFKELKLLKLNDIIKQTNILFTHNAINGNTPDIFKDYFTFNEVDHLHDTVNNLNSVYSIPKGSLKLPNFKTNAGKSSIKYICSSTWNHTLKDLSIKNVKKYSQDPFWLNKTDSKTLKHILKTHFLENY